MNYIKKIAIQGFKRFENFEMYFNKDISIIVGENETGKSTVLEAICIVLNQMYKNTDKYIIKDMLNIKQIEKFKKNPKIENLPQIKIELTFELDGTNREASTYFGENNLNGKENEDFGILFECKLDMELYQDLLLKEIEKGEIPYEYYTMTWTSFSGLRYKVLKKPLNAILIDTSITDSIYTFNYFNKSLFLSKFTESERLNAKNNFRHNIDEAFSKLRLDTIDENRAFGINSKKLALETILSIFDEGIPLENKGKGLENLIKTKIALDKSKNKLDVVMIEEPENHLCHTNLRQMLSVIEERIGETQLILTTHNNMIASRLSINNVIWISNNKSKRLDDIDNKSADFFKKADDNSFLNFLLASKIILVEGSTEYLLIPKFYEQLYNRTIENDGVSIISCKGISYNRYLEIAYETNKKVAVITDNDKNKSKIDKMLSYNDEHKNQHIFMSKDTKDWTWEVCLYNSNKNVLDKKIKIDEKSEYLHDGKDYGKVLGKMLNNKVEIAYQILIQEMDLEIPNYIKEAFEWINE